MEGKAYLSIGIFSLMLGMATADNCFRRRIVHTIRVNDCQPKRLLSFACSGACPSYARLSSTNPNEILRLCSCCQEINKVRRRVAIFCPNKPGAFRPFRRMVIRIVLPTKCMCRPCSVLPDDLIPSENKFLESVTKKSFDGRIALNSTGFVLTVPEEDHSNEFDEEMAMLNVSPYQTTKPNKHEMRNLNWSYYAVIAEEAVVKMSHYLSCRSLWIETSQLCIRFSCLHMLNI